MIVITGITGGIGSFLFRKYIQAGEKVIGTYHLTKPEDRIFRESIQVDITDYLQVEKVIESLKSELKEITLINCAGITHNSFAHKADVNEWSQVINVNLVGTYHVIRALLPLMREQNYGRIINLSSVVAKTGVMGTSAYAASKAGINGMIKSIALENGQKNITINNINLGYFNVGMINTVPGEMQEKIKSRIACNEFGDAGNIFNTIQYIRQTPYLTGSCIDLNGGLM